jgi:hypothetical protein
MRTLLTAAALAVALPGAAQAALTLTAFGGFVQDSASGFPDPTNYWDCALNTAGTNNICAGFSWGVGTAAAAGPFDPAQSGASINVIYDGIEPGDQDPREFQVEVDPKTLGEFFVLGTLTHYNEPILSDAFMGEIAVEYDITIEDTVSGESVNFVELFDLMFSETLNEAPCDPTPNPSGSPTPCDDTYEFFGTDFEEFTLGGVDYTISIIGFCDGTTPDTCSDGLFYSAEGESSTGFVLEVKQQVPAPGVLALLSAGLIGLGLSRRRQVKP